MAIPADRDSRWEELKRLRQEGDWQGALWLCSQQHDPLLLWLRPTLDLLHFLGSSLRALGVSALVSLGCGSGLFEWLLACATGLRVVGVEVNREWWECRYSPPTFLQLLFQDEIDVNNNTEKDCDDNRGEDGRSGEEEGLPRIPQEADGSRTPYDGEQGLSQLLEDPDAALLFCYFNDMAAFLGYLSSFRGGCLVVAGPGPGSPAHCQPQPFSADIPSPWAIAHSARIGTTQDWVAVYTRIRSDS